MGAVMFPLVIIFSQDVFDRSGWCRQTTLVMADAAQRFSSTLRRICGVSSPLLRSRSAWGVAIGTRLGSLGDVPTAIGTSSLPRPSRGRSLANSFTGERTPGWWALDTFGGEVPLHRGVANRSRLARRSPDAARARGGLRLLRQEVAANRRSGTGSRHGRCRVAIR